MKSLRAVIAGWASMTVLVVIGTAVAASVMLRAESSPTLPYLTVNLLYSTAFAAVGGWVAARLAPWRTELHVGVLAGIVALLGVASAMSAPPQSAQPGWYGWVIALLGACGVLAGGAVAVRRGRGGAAAPSAARRPA
jgi:hypothetical protein